MTVGQKLSEISKHWIKNRDNLMKVNACGFSGFAMLAMSAPPEKNCGQFLDFCQYINRNKKNWGPFLIVVSKTVQARLQILPHTRFIAQKTPLHWYKDNAICLYV